MSAIDSADPPLPSRMTSSPGRYAKGRAKRQEIIETAMAVFGTEGYNRSSILTIAERCAVSRAGLMHYFPSKSSILQAVLQWRDDEDRKTFAGAPGSGFDGLRILRGIVALARHNATIPGLIGMYAILSAEATASDHPAHEYFVARSERIRRGTARALGDLRETGRLRGEHDPHRLALRLIALQEGLQNAWLLTPDEVDVPGELEAAIEEILTVPLAEATV